MYFIDIELTKDWFYVGVLTPDDEHLIFHKPSAKIKYILKHETTVGFNSLQFDMPLIAAWLDDASIDKLYNLANRLVSNEAKPWDYFDQDDYDHVDLKEPAPGVHVSLKLYMARMHAKRIDDMFHDQSSTVDAEETYAYNLNDLIGTKMLYQAIKHEIDLREHMGKEFGLDLRSRSGAQIAERVLVKMANYGGGRPERPSYVRYKVPKGRVKFKTPELKELKKHIESHKFVVNENGKAVLPEWLGKKHPVVIDGRKYVMGIGGLHAENKSEVYEGEVVEIDCASMYPSLMIRNEFFPQHTGKRFLETYKRIYDERMAVKKRMAEIKKELEELDDE